ncbi:MAG: invasion associated locus B family protein [Parafilimonas terrae]|nr:invasion associated locus B family protein [Parafilimonas terrae]
MARARLAGGALGVRAFGLAALALVAGMTGPVGAQETKLATLDSVGASIPGDRMTVVRPFGAWTLRCELSVSQNQRICALEQVLQREAGAVLWRLAQAVDGGNVLVWSVPAAMDRSKGLTLKLDDFQTAVTGWTCRSACLSVKPLTPAFRTLLLGASTVEASYTLTDGETVTVSGTMAGFREAIRAASEDPFALRKPMPEVRRTRGR